MAGGTAARQRGNVKCIARGSEFFNMHVFLYSFVFIEPTILFVTLPQYIKLRFQTGVTGKYMLWCRGIVFIFSSICIFFVSIDTIEMQFYKSYHDTINVLMLFITWILKSYLLANLTEIG